MNGVDRMSSIIDRCGNCGSSRVVVDESGDATCAHCGAPLCDHCSQVLEAHRKEDGTVGRRHERDDLKVPRCPAHKAELVEQRRARMRLIQGGKSA